ncbi:MAG: MrcB family domain-containing protein [Bacillota bacterium]
MSENNVGLTIKQFREDNNLNQIEVAKSVGITESALSKIENGKQKIDASLLVALTRVFQCTTDQLLGLQRAPVLSTKIEFKSDNNISLRNKFLYILSNYLAATQQEFKGHRVGEFVRGEAAQAVGQAGQLNDPFKVVGSVGQGRWAEVPWIAIFNQQITSGAQQGFYIVYLFSADLKRVYLSFNQGYTYFGEKYGRKMGRGKIAQISKTLRSDLHIIPENLKISSIRLEGDGHLARGYELGHICGAVYETSNMPSDETLAKDLSDMLIVYQELFSMMQGRTVKQFNDYLLLKDDLKYIEAEEQDADFQEAVEKSATNLGYVEDEEEKLEERRDPLIDNGGGKHWPRDAQRAAKALIMANFKCAVDANHATFTSKKTNKPYVEAHHLLPIYLQQDFDKNLDRVTNIVSLCPNCHRLLHHGDDNERHSLILKLFSERRDALERLGIEITPTQLLKAYNVEVD